MQLGEMAEQSCIQAAGAKRFLGCALLLGASLLSAAAAQNVTPAVPPPPTVSSDESRTPAPGPPGAAAPQSPDGQQPQAQPQSAEDQGGTFVFRKQVEEVALHATVFDGRRNLVPGLGQNAFSVFENGAPQTITSFRRQDAPVALGIVVDNSGSMRDKRDEVNRAVLNLIRASNPDDEIFVVNFGPNYYLDQDFTSDVHLLESALHQVSSSGNTALYDAIVASAVHLNHNPRLEKRVLLVITDGQDNMSQETLEEASRRLQQTNGPTLYAIGLMGGEIRETGRGALEELAQATGGVAYFPDSLDQVADMTQTIAHDIRSQYIITYRRKNQTAPLNAQSLRVEAHAPGYSNLTVNARSGRYYSGGATH
jgi:Ca-activated chloride channel family protein